MNKYVSIELTDILYYKHAKFVFKNGITTIRGLNKNSHVEKNTNGVGKSLLFSCIPNIIYATTPLAKKNDKKSLFRTNKSEIRFTFKKDGATWTVVQKAKKSSIDYQILKDGVDTKPRTVPIAEAKIKELFGISEELFYTKDYISIQRPHLFLRGTSTQRQEFFTEVFKLDHYDKLKAGFLAQIRELKSKKIKLDGVKEQLAEVVERLAEIAWDNKKEKQINLLETELNGTNESYVGFITALTDLQGQLRLAEQIQKKERKLDSKFTVAEVKEKQKEYKALLTSLQEYNEYKRARKKYAEDTESLQSRLDKLTKELKGVEGGDKSKLEDLSRRLKKLGARRSDLQSNVHSIKKLRTAYSELESELPDKPPTISSEQLSVRIGELEQIIELHGAVSQVSKDCPLCGSKISRDAFRRIARDAETELPKRKKDLKVAKGFARLKEIKKEAAEYKGCEDELAGVQDKISSLENEKANCERYNRLQSSIKDITSSLRKISKPVPVDRPDTDKSERELESKIRSYSELLSGLKELKELKNEQVRAGEIKSVETLESEVNKVKKKQAKLISTINKINEVLPNLLSQQKQVIEHTKTKLDLEARIKTTEDQLGDLPVLEALIKAYGSKGLKVDVMKKIGSLVEANLNKYSSLIFAEAFTFKIEIAENSFAVIVDRGNDKVSDINKLSGYEGSAFILLLLLSMLPLIPRNLRADTIILDECDALMGPSLKRLYFTKFLPVLNSVVPKICVITTDTKVQVEGARNMLVEKEGETSTLREVFELGGIL